MNNKLISLINKINNEQSFVNQIFLNNTQQWCLVSSECFHNKNYTEMKFRENFFVSVINFQSQWHFENEGLLPIERVTICRIPLGSMTIGSSTLNGRF